MNVALWVAVVLQQLIGATSPPDGARVEREAWAMGTRVRLTVEAQSRTQALMAAEQALREIESVERLLSTWDPDSPLSRLNRAPPGAWTAVVPDVAGILGEATDWAGRTDGAFEARIGPLVEAWDLRGEGRAPTDDELARAMAHSGAGSVELAEGRLRRRSAAAWIDAGAFGKGAALRAAGRRLDSIPGEVRALVDLGGQILALAPPESPWVVEVAHPFRRAEPVASLAIHDGSLSTSGTSERGRHVLDPRTGRPVEAWGSVTVVSPDPLAADALSTALYVMGPAEGLEWAERAGVGALFLRNDPPRAAWSSSLAPLLVAQPEL